jgi:hypothetical protein
LTSMAAHGTHPETVRKWCRRGKFPHAFQLPGGSGWRVPSRDLPSVPKPATGDLAALERRVASLERTRKDTASASRVEGYLSDILRRLAALEGQAESGEESSAGE